MRTKPSREYEIFKVTIISSVGSPPYLGGIENVIDTVIKSNLRRSYEFKIFDTYRKPDPERKITDKILFGLMLVVECFRHLYKGRPNLVHIHFCSKVDFWKHSICLVIAKSMGVKTIFHLHGGSFDAFYNSQRKFIRSIIRKILLLPDMLIALSLYWRNFLSNIAETQKIRIVPNPINCIELSQYVREMQPEDLKAIVLIGSLGRRKGHYDALKAMPYVLERHKDAYLYFAGVDEDLGATISLKKIAASSRIEKNVHFLGPVTGEDKLRLFGKASMIILPSYAENMPISVLEGMAAAKPVIATRVGALPEVIDDNVNGLLINPGDWRDLANNIIELLDHPEKQGQIGSRARQKVQEKWDISCIEPVYEGLYQELK